MLIVPKPYTRIPSYLLALIPLDFTFWPFYFYTLLSWLGTSWFYLLYPFTLYPYTLWLHPFTLVPPYPYTVAHFGIRFGSYPSPLYLHTLWLYPDAIVPFYLFDFTLFHSYLPSSFTLAPWYPFLFFSFTLDVKTVLPFSFLHFYPLDSTCLPFRFCSSFDLWILRIGPSSFNPFYFTRLLFQFPPVLLFSSGLHPSDFTLTPLGIYSSTL